MGITDWFRGFFDKDNKIKSLSSCGYDADMNLKYNILALETGIELISKTILRSEFQTFEKGNEVRKENYYLLNVEPNQNTSASLFWKETIRKLIIDGEALILVLRDGKLQLADSFTRTEYAFVENTYTGVNTKGHDYDKVWKESEVLYLHHGNDNIRSAIDTIQNDFAKLISSSVKGYQNSKARKGKLKIPSSLPKTLEGVEDLQAHIASSMKDFMDPSKDAVFPEDAGFEYVEIAESKGSKSNDSGRETKNFINDIFDFVSIRLNIAPSLLKGDTVNTKDAVNNFITFCINPIVKMIQDEINRKMYKKKAYLESTYLKIDTSNIKAVDLRDIANSVDILNRNGALTIDDILKILGKEPIGGEYGTARFITKNLELLEAALKAGQISDRKGE